MNKYDYDKMIKDFKSEENYLNNIRKTKNKWKNESKKYLLKLEQMKEKKEENYNHKRNALLKEYLKKQKDIERQLYRTRISKQGGWQLNSQLMKKKEVLAKEKQKKKNERDERERLEIENHILSKSKK